MLVNDGWSMIGRDGCLTLEPRMRKPPTAREMSGIFCTICPSFFVFLQHLGL